jgi:hypothetical protein
MSQMLCQFDITEWADYVRDLVWPLQRRRMQAHLRRGCPQCSSNQEWLSRFAGVCAGLAVDNTSKHAEQPIKAVPSQNQPRPMPALKRVWAILRYDSLNDCQSAGMRSGQPICRYLLFQAGNYSVDVRFEREKQSATLVLTGQIANRTDPKTPLAHAPVMLFSDSRELTRCLTNTFGEFQFEYAPQPDLHLRVPLETTGQELQVTLSDRKTFEIASLTF